MLGAQESSNCWKDLGFKDEFAGNDCDAEGDYDLCIDVDQLLDILDEDPKDDHDASQRFSECSMLTNASQDEAIPGSTTDDNNRPDSGTQVSKGEHPVGGDSAEPIASHTLCSFKHSESGNGVSVGFLDLEANLDVIFNKKVQEPSTLSCSPLIGSEANLDLIFNEVEPTTYSRSSVNDNSATYGDWFQLAPGNDASVAEKAGVLLHPCSAASSFSGEKNISGHRDAFNLSMLQGEYKNPFTHADVLPYSVIENANVVFNKYDTLGENTANTISPLGNSCATMESFMNADTSWNLNCSKSTVYWSSHAMSDYPATFHSMSIDDYLEPDKMKPHSLAGLDMQFSPNQERTYVKEEVGKVPTESACSSNKIELNDQGLRTGTNVSEHSVTHYSDVSGWHYGFDCNDYDSSVRCTSFCENGYSVNEKVSTQQSTCPQSCIPANERDTFVKDEKTDELVSYGKNMWCSYDDAVSRKQFSSTQDKCFTKKIKQSLPAVSFSLSNHKAEFCRDEEEDMMVASQRFSHFPDNTQRYGISPDNNGRSDMNTLNWSPSAHSFTSSANQPSSMCSQHSKVSTESIHSTFSERSTIEDDNEVCIIEEMSHPAPSKLSPIVKNTIVTSQRSVMNGNYMGSGGIKSKARDECFILRAALQDLSQSKSEAIPPDGVLAVPLLRHQRIALSWMVQKETNSAYCCGGILADDQGLGKTISTIALILKERRPPSSRGNSDVKECKMEALNLDEDEDILLENGRIKQGSDTCQIMPKKTSIKSMNSIVQGKGRPAAGTLVVCPTSVLRQWAEELHNKVTSKANLSVLVYHGSNRTKDPCELAKYDVVLTTYAIVGMEVPKQPIGDEDDEEKRNSEHGYSSREFSSGNKRKNPTSSDKKTSKNKKGLDGALIEFDVRPLAKVGWFRVVLDEAQSIKNHRTQVARACWGLRAKRRWCLSGTPIQNAIDDLYSYFRFLKYDPYSIYKSFCSTIKVPISRSPANGYRKLQAVLKTIMLRRTKGTLLDGEPIITLPPKLVELKKVDFSKEERDFYSRLEADSRAQFKEYAAAGTVKENYVNILLMLLRLRQACDHPLLVKRFNLRSLWKSSVEAAKKLPHDEKKHLLSCLEASLAICGICNDSPEDAVVSKCGHVFCNQCICEHLTGDDNQCPNTNCKVRLNMSSVFSRGTLNSSLYDQPCENESLPCAGSEFEKIAESFHEGLLYNSSKIKAALEVLQSLCKPKDCFSENGSANNILNGNAIRSENSSHVHAVEPLMDDTLGKQVLDVRMSSDDNSVQAVGKKAIVFSQWTRMLDLLEACLKSSSIQYRRLDGTMSVTARDKAVKDFNTLPEVSVMIMSLKAASLGLNMVAACYVLLLDLWWNPTTEDQAIDRAHRIGQTRPVTVLRLTVRDTVEDRILALQQKKRQMVASAFGEDENGGRQTRLTVDDLNYLFMM